MIHIRRRASGLGGYLSRRVPVVALALSAFAHPAFAGSSGSGYEYLSPLPGARLVSPWNNVVVRPGGPLDATGAGAASLAVVGDHSGPHQGRLVVSDDRRSLVFIPSLPFTEGERVTVSLGAGLTGRGGVALPQLEYSFSIAPCDPRRIPPMVEDAATGRIVPLAAVRARAASPEALWPAETAAASDTLPPGYPTVALMASDQASAGNVFIAPFGYAPRGHLLILDNAAQPMFYRRLSAPAYDFKRQPTGLLTYFDGASWPPTFWGLDSSYAVVDYFRAGNGYYADMHELQVLPNRHALLLCYDTQPVPMDAIVPGGRPNALVIGAIIQELDQAKNVVFQWRSWDHFDITDADTCLLSFRDSLVDYVHANAIELDVDGNLLLSSRSMSEITKIDHVTGDIIWRCGPFASKNQFSFPNDTRGFAAQHDIRRLPNGHVTLFDNANCQFDTIYSRAAEYALDEVNKVATLVWQARNAPDLYAAFMGNVQRLDDGNSMIGWGGTSDEPKVTEVRPDGSLAFALGFGSPGVWTYRALRFPWRTTRFAVTPDSLDLGAVAIGDADTIAVTLRNGSAGAVSITSIIGQGPPFSVAAPLPLTLAAGEAVPLLVCFAPTHAGAFERTLYVRSVFSTELVARTLVLRGSCQANGVWIEDVSRREGDVGPSPLEFRVRLTQASGQDVSVAYQTADGTATAADADYVSASGRVTISAGDSTAVIVVDASGDMKVESNETFFVDLTDATGDVIARPRATGTIVNDDGPLGVDSGSSAPHRFGLDPARPNPTRSAATIAYDVPTACMVRLEVFDLSGRRVQTLVDAWLRAGRHEVTWTPKPGATGVFFCRLRAGEFVAMRRAVIVR